MQPFYILLDGVRSCIIVLVDVGFWYMLSSRNKNMSTCKC
jgi:hypothetical protein